MKRFTQKYTVPVIVFIAILAAGVKFVSAQYYGPTASPPGNNPLGPVWLQTAATPGHQSGKIDISGAAGSDIYLFSNSAIRADLTSGNSSINISNYGNTPTGFTLNVKGDLKILSGLTGTTGNLYVPQICLGAAGSEVCRTTWPSGSGGTLTGGGTANYVPLWSGATTLGNSSIYQDASNRIGIGTSSPAEKLHIVGAGGEDGIVVDAATYPEIVFDRTGVHKAYLGIAGTAGGYAAGSLADSLVLRSQNALHLVSNASTIGLTVNGGNVGIDTTTPAAEVQIADIGAAGTKNLMVGDDTYFTDLDWGNALGLYGVYDSSIGILQLGSSAGANITGAAGHIGITTANFNITPAGRLTIAGQGGSAANDGIEFFTTTNGSGYSGWAGREFIDVPSGGWGTAPYVFSVPNTSGVEVKTMTLLNGRVGVGTQAPAVKLDVVSTAEGAAISGVASNALSTGVEGTGVLYGVWGTGTGGVYGIGSSAGVIGSAQSAAGGGGGILGDAGLGVVGTAGALANASSLGHAGGYFTSLEGSGALRSSFAFAAATPDEGYGGFGGIVGLGDDYGGRFYQYHQGGSYVNMATLGTPSYSGDFAGPVNLNSNNIVNVASIQNSGIVLTPQNIGGDNGLLLKNTGGVNNDTDLQFMDGGGNSNNIRWETRSGATFAQQPEWQIGNAGDPTLLIGPKAGSAGVVKIRGFLQISCPSCTYNAQFSQPTNPGTAVYPLNTASGYYANIGNGDSSAMFVGPVGINIGGGSTNSGAAPAAGLEVGTGGKPNAAQFDGSVNMNSNNILNVASMQANGVSEYLQNIGGDNGVQFYNTSVDISDLQLKTSTGKLSNIRLQNAGGMYTGNTELQIGKSDYAPLVVEARQDNTIGKVAVRGLMGIGTGSPTVPLDVVGSANVSVSGWAYTSTGVTGAFNTSVPVAIRTTTGRILAQGGEIDVASDGRAKDIQSRLSSKESLDKIMKLSPVDYKWKYNTDKADHLGLIAQEVAKVIPEALTIVDGKINGKDVPDFHMLDYNEVGIVAIGAIQEQQKEIDSLKAQNADLLKRVEALEAKVK